ncbi:MAG: FAD-dependent oxidoreductase [archaeon]
MKKVGIIGAGVFGCSTALELVKAGFEVTLFDRANNILEGASTINHLRHHYGFHYPRSKETVEEIKVSRESFEKEYGECVSEFFDDYYGCSLIGSKTTPEDFIKFCDELKLPYEIKSPEDKFMDKKNIGVCIKTPERVYDPDILKGLLLKKLRESKVKLRLNHKIIGGEVSEQKKTLKFEVGNTVSTEEFDFLINATYSNFNSFNKWFGFPRKKLQYELMELLEVYIPNAPKIGLTIMDGAFSSLLPRGEKGTFTLGHVDASVLRTAIGDDIDPVVMATGEIKSNRAEIMKKGIEDYPFLKEGIVVKSLHITRVVKANVEATDERPSEITEYGNGMYSIFGGKIITCIDIAKKVLVLIQKELAK